MPILPKGNRRTFAVKARKTFVDGKRNAFKGIDKSNSHIYKSNHWLKVRQIVLHKQPICVMCEANGRYTTANTIDHIQPINKGGDVFALNNLQALCSSCHNSKSAKDREGHRNI
tara:strand:+ start:4073 stop:4414 length:342 start_codon:yes stop_codon:yes gene_type:complete